MEQISADLRRKIASGTYISRRTHKDWSTYTGESNTRVNQTCHYRSALRAIDDIYFTVPIGVYKETGVNRTAQTRDSIIPDAVNQAAEWMCLSECKKIPSNSFLYLGRGESWLWTLSKHTLAKLLIFFTLPVRAWVHNGGPKEISAHSFLLLMRLFFAPVQICGVIEHKILWRLFTRDRQFTWNKWT